MDRIDIQDRPIEGARDDRLNRVPFIANIIKALVVEERDLTGRVIARHSAGVVVGLVGKWGSGKSSVLNLLAESLGKLDHVVVATLNPWLFKGRDELLAAFFNELRDALGKNLNEREDDVLTALNRYQWAISGVAHAGALSLDLHGGAGAATTVAKKVLGWLDKRKAKERKPLSPQEERRSLEEKLKAKRVAVVVLIDELDRLEDEEVRAVAQLVKAVGDIKGISYLVAYDPKRVTEALGKGVDPQRSGAAHLEKIIQHPIPLRPLFPNDVETLMALAFEHRGVKPPDEFSENEQAILQFIKNSITTPREIKRLIGSYGILEPMVRGEISECDIIAYCWLITKSEPLRDGLMRHLDGLVDDPPEEAFFAREVARSAGPQSPVDLLGPPAEEFDQLLRLLFPTFGNAREGEAGNRISRRRNLVRLLYLGSPPGMINRGDVERLWGNHDVDALVMELIEALAGGTLSPIIDRLDDLLSSLDPAGDETFWPALSRALIRREDWARGETPNGSLAEDAATYLLRFGARGDLNANRVKRALAALERESDLIIAPLILRKHLFAFGMTKHGRARGGQVSLNEAEVSEMLSRELPRYRAALIDGWIIRRIPSIEALFVIENTGGWDEPLREALTEQLAVPEARVTLASLLVPPGYGVEPNFLDELVDAARVLTWMDDSQQGTSLGNTWLDASLARFRRALEGKPTIGWHGSDD